MGRLSVKMLRHLLVSTILFASLPAAAQQQSQGYKFLEAVRKEDGDAVVKMLDQPGQRIVNARDVTSGEGALHIVVKRGDSTYLRYLLQRGADPNMRDGRGDTPLLLAVQYGQNALVEVLTAGKANPNLGNGGGETPLIRAVQKRDLSLVRSLLAAGANPDQTDNIAGMSARDYARADSRAPAIAKLIDEKPKKAPRTVAGPRL
jgi:ankyrin repeat protein